MVKPLTFKGDKPTTKKRKRTTAPSDPPTNPTPTTNPSSEDESWLPCPSAPSLTGPVTLLLTLPPSAPSFLSTDALGRVFPSPVINILDDNPSTAEPDDVRQVWVAQRIVGSEDRFTFKGHHGRYLSCDGVGSLSAGREAVGGEEVFLVKGEGASEGVGAEGGEGVFTLQTGAKGRYISLSSSSTAARGTDAPKLEFRGDAEEPIHSSPPRASSADDDDDTSPTTSTPSATTRIHIQMQSRFVPRVISAKAAQTRAKISRKELEEQAGRTLTEEEVVRLKKARREGDFYEKMLDVKVKGKHDKFA